MEKVKNPKFLAAQQKIEQQKKEVETAQVRKSNWEGTEEIKYLGLEDKQERVFRIIGDPLHVREKGTDPKLIFYSEIVRDDLNGYTQIIWPWIEADGKYKPDPNWILTRLYNTVMDGEWKERSEAEIAAGESRWYKIPSYGETEVYKRIKGNRKQEDKGFARRFWPSQKVLMNVIDRHDTWCKDNKHTKCLSSKVTTKIYPDKDEQGNPTEKEITFAATGVPATLYTSLFEHFMRRCGDWSFDAVVTKDAANKKYNVIDAAVTQMISQHSTEISSVDELTDEEKAYELFDFDKLKKITTYNKLKKTLSGLFKLCDANLGTNFYEELCELEAKEAEEYKAQKEAQKEIEVSPEESDVSSVEETPIVNTPVEEVVETESTVSTTDTLTDNDLIVVFPNFDNLSDEDKTILRNSVVRIIDGRPFFKSGSDELTCFINSCKYPNSNLDTLFPSIMKQCPVCGATEKVE